MSGSPIAAVPPTSPRATPPGPSDQDHRGDDVAEPQGDGPLDIRGEDPRRQEADEEAANRPARRDRQVEPRQMPRTRPEPHQLAVTDHRHEEQRPEIQCDPARHPERDRDDGRPEMLQRHTAPIDSTDSAANTARRYQRSWSKQMMKVSR